jgi:hypothetical protein
MPNSIIKAFGDPDNFVSDPERKGAGSNTYK